MSSAPFDVALVVARLKSQVPELQLIEGAARYAAITGLRDFRPDSAYVLLLKESSSDETATAGRGRQRAQVEFGVVLAITNYRDVRGGESVNQASPLIGRVRDALIGWEPELRGARPCQWLRGEVLDYDADTLLWAETYRAQHFIG